VDGYNLPVVVSATGGAHPNKCAIAGCSKNMNAVCLPELQVTATGSGRGKTVVGSTPPAAAARMRRRHRAEGRLFNEREEKMTRK
jgi:hypothetical protein